MGDSVLVLIAMILYLGFMVFLGVFFAKRSNKSTDEFFIGGRKLGPWVAAMSAEASDMSGWLLMGLPGVAYWIGIADAFWTALGLGIGTYLNWLIVSKRLRRYSVIADNAITVPDFFSNRFKEKGALKPLLLLSSLMILIFFSIYVATCFVTFGKLFVNLFGFDYRLMMIIGAVVVIAYTFLGGFLAESVSDFIQGIVMIFALMTLLIAGIVKAGGLGNVFSNVSNIPGFLEFFGIANPIVENNSTVITFGAPGTYGFLTIISTMAWGLGYFGMPQVLLRFMAIRKESELTMSRRIATIWCFLAMGAAVLIGILGRSIENSIGISGKLMSASAAENIFIELANILFHPLFAGIIMAGILAAAMSSSDSYLLISASAFAKNIFSGILNRKATDKQIMFVSRITLLVVSIFGVFIAWDENSVIFQIVSFAWAGFGAAFGPLMLFSLFWKRINLPGAISGMLTGAGMVFLWKLVLKPMGGVWGIYELLPSFIISSIVIVVVSLLTKPPSDDIIKELELAKNQN